MNRDQLRAVEAVIDEGSFEAAAFALHVTPSAISQRIKALEASLGHLLVRRTTPTQVTDEGVVVLRYARQVSVLEADALSELGTGPGGRVSVPVAVNADSLDGWFAGVFEDAATWDDMVLSLRVEDQDHSLALLRRADVVGAVTAEAAPVVGCAVVPLGAMRYRPVAARTLRERYLRGGELDWAVMPSLRFGAKDSLQSDYLQRMGLVEMAPVMQVPSSTGFAAAVRAGAGWGMVPEGQLGQALSSGQVVLLDDGHLDVQLCWQHWRLASARIERLTAAISRAARVLRPSATGAR